MSALLFDLDGTLIDSAPDLAGAANDMRMRRSMPALPIERLRPHAGSGARGMLATALAVAPGDAGYEALREEFYMLYEARMLQQTRVFEAIIPLLEALDRHGLPWGIVTNKALRFAEPQARALGLLDRSQALVAGDSTAFTKPHPGPLLEAARRLGQPASSCAYIGDDPRDMQAGRAAGMATLAAAWGYLGVASAIDAWQADHVLAQPSELLHWLDLA